MEPDIPFGVTLLNDGIFAAGILLVVAVAILVGLDQRLVGAGKVGWILAVVFLPVLAVLSAASLLLGNFAALAQTNVRRLLAYSAIAHAGALVLGVITARGASAASAS